MNHNFQDFESDLHAQGFDEVVEVNWPPLTIVDTHVHAFAAKALVVRGEMWLTVGDRTQRIQPGGTFQLAKEEPHSERYGHEGATYWVGRRKGP
jgi:quercetin dioxygenase-like cupin family protein